LGVSLEDVLGPLPGPSEEGPRGGPTE
jgi:hypothetical protein